MCSPLHRLASRPMFRQSGITSTCVNVMSKSVKFVLDLHGLNELMKSEWMQGELNEAAEQVVSRAGASYMDCDYRTHLGSWTAITNIYPATPEAAKMNLDTNLLAVALYGGGS